MKRLTLQPGKFYGWTMFPGYADEPYHSPIQVKSVTPLGGRKFDLAFLNIFYAAGVQRMEYSLRTLRRERTYIVAEQLLGGQPNDRVIIIEELNARWIERSTPALSGRIGRLFDANGEPVETAFLALVS